jgi:hypothetical protein
MYLSSTSIRGRCNYSPLKRATHKINSYYQSTEIAETEISLLENFFYGSLL